MKTCSAALAPFLAGVLAIAVSACSDDPKYPYEQSVEKLRTLPRVIHVAPGDTVTLSVRLLGDDDGRDIPLPEWARDTITGDDATYSGHVVHWEFDVPPVDGIELTPMPSDSSPGRHRMWLSVRSDVAAGETADVRATAGDASGKVLVLVQAPGAVSNILPSQQFMMAAPGSKHVQLLAEENGAPGSEDWSLRAYSAGFLPSEMVSTGASLDAVHLTWGSGLSFLDGASTGSGWVGGGVIQMPLRFWLATGGLTAGGDSILRLKTRIGEDLEIANHIFAENRVGTSFVNVDNDIHEVPALDDFYYRSCPSLREEIGELDSNLAGQLGLSLLHVVYTRGKVNELYRGRACLNDAGYGFVVLFLSNRAPTSLAHELGHALGLDERTELDEGHANTGGPNYDAGNLMWTYLELSQATDRGRIFVGQTHWMTANWFSFLSLAKEAPYSSTANPIRPPGLPEDLDCRDSSTPCPSLSLRMEVAE